jgi:hypothetical protein
MIPRGALSIALLFALPLAAPCARAAEAVLIVQRSPLAGFRHYDGGSVLRELRPGDRLELVRESRNPYDANAVRVEWRGVMLGYVPRRDNAPVARQMDHGVVLQARLAEVRENRNRSVRLEVEVIAPLPTQ